jgi:hypothetical protein
MKIKTMEGSIAEEHLHGRSADSRDHLADAFDRQELPHVALESESQVTAYAHLPGQRCATRPSNVRQRSTDLLEVA